MAAYIILYWKYISYSDIRFVGGIQPIVFSNILSARERVKELGLITYKIVKLE